METGAIIFLSIVAVALHRNFPTSTLRICKKTPPLGRVYFLADGEGFPRTALARRLRGNRDDLTALHWSNLLVVEQGFSSAPPIHKIKNAPLGRVYFLADGEGFEPPVELPPQRFSRPSQSTALPPILNFFTDGLSAVGFVR